MANKEIQRIMELTPENLAARQLEALQQHACEVLQKVQEALLSGSQKDLDALTFSSPSGDCMGVDSTCINFEYKERELMDIQDIFDDMDRLKRLAGGAKDGR